MEQLTHYQILEIDQTATLVEIRKKYLEKAYIYHPDKYYNLPRDQYLEIEHKFQLITRAFQVLSDPDQRAKYDLHLKYSATQKPQQNNVFCAYKNGSYSFNVSPVILEFANKLFSNQKMQNIKDFLNVFGQFASTSNINQNDVNLPEIIRNYKIFFQKKEQERKNCEDNHKTQLVKKPSQSQTKREPKREPISKSENENKSQLDKNPNKNPNKNLNKNVEDNLIYTANVSLKDIYQNVEKVLNVPRKRVCTHCLGVGYLGYGPDMSLCQICKGLMIISDSKIFPVDVKRNRIVFEKEGNQRLEHPPGDLIINVQPKPHLNFKIINQYDLLHTHDISLIELYQYLEIQFEHLDGKIYNIIYDPDPINLNILKDKCLLKVKGKGLLKCDNNSDNSDNRGDLYIHLKVKYPDLTRQQFIDLKKILINTHDIHNKSDIELQAELPDESYKIDS